MGPIEWATENEQKLRIGDICIFVALVACVSVVWSLSSRPALRYEVTSQTDIVPPDAKNAALGLSVDEEGLDPAKNVLTLLTLRVSNVGNVEFRRDDFSQSDPLGFVVMNGQIVEPPQVVRSSNSQWGRMKVLLRNRTHAVIRPMRLPPGEFADLKILAVRRTRDKNPLSLIPTGSLDGLEKIDLAHVDELSAKPTFLQAVFRGSLLVHLTRAACYIALGFVGVLMMIVLDRFAFGRQNDRLQQTRNRVAAEYRAEPGFRSNGINETVLGEYRSRGIQHIEKLVACLQPQQLATMSRVHRQVEDATLGIEEQGEIELARREFVSSLSVKQRELYHLFQILEALGAVAVSDGEVEPCDYSWQEELAQFLTYLKGHRYYRRRLFGGTTTVVRKAA